MFDIRVLDTLALSYLSHSPPTVLASGEAEKRQKYCIASSNCSATFMPLRFSVDGLAGDEANSFFPHLACSLSVKWDLSFSEILGWLCAHLAFNWFGQLIFAFKA